jgi:hypothetical protein
MGGVGECSQAVFVAFPDTILRPPPFTWTPERLAYLREHYGVDQSASEIAQVFGVGRGAVAGQAHRLGLSCTPEVRTRHCERAQTRRNFGREPTRPGEAPTSRDKRKFAAAVRDREPLPPPREAPRDPRPLTRLNVRTCRFPVAGEGADTLFCGDPVVAGTSWCKACRPRVYLPVKSVDVEAFANFMAARERRVITVKR